MSEYGTYNDNAEPSKVTRRTFLTAAMAMAAMLKACRIEATTSRKQPNSLPSNNATSEVITATPYPNDPAPDVALRQTATAIAKKGENTSFVPDKEFSKEFFERVRQAAFIVEVDGKVDGNPVGGIGSGWLAKNNKGKFVLVTTDHQFANKGEITSLRLWRPGIDTQKIEPTRFVIHSFPAVDQAVTIIDIPEGIEPIEGLDYKPNTTRLKKDTDVLVAGFPSEFYDEQDKFNKTPIMGSHLKVEENANIQTGEWLTRGDANGGTSGSVAVINENGLPLAVGVIRSVGRESWRSTDKQLGARNLIHLMPVYVDLALDNK